MAENFTTTDAQGKLTLSGGVSENYYYVRSLFFNSVTDDSLSFNSQITDNWLEDNTSIQDHITISPITITMKGLIGEVVYTPADARNDKLNVAYSTFKENMKSWALGKLNTISAFLPQASNITQKVIDQIALKEETINKAVSVANVFNMPLGFLAESLQEYLSIPSNIRQEKQKKIIEELRHAWLNRRSFIAETPWGEYDNMFIQSVNVNQGNVNYSSEISITLKQVRYASTITTKADKKVLASYAQIAQADEENYGKAGTRRSLGVNILGLQNSEYKTFQDN